MPLEAFYLELSLEMRSCRLFLCACRGVKGYYGHLSKLGTIDTKTTAAIVCTIEKANTLINKLLEEGKLSSTISTVVVDELHMVIPQCIPLQCLRSVVKVDLTRGPLQVKCMWDRRKLDKSPSKRGVLK